MEKRVLFDLTKTQPINGIKFHGGGKYGIAVFIKMVEKYPEYVAAYYDENKFINPAIKPLCEKKIIPLISKREMSVIDAAKKFGGFLYSPLNDSAYVKDPAVHAVVTIHGLRMLEMPYDEYEFAYNIHPAFFKKILQKLSLFNFFLKRKRKKDVAANLNKMQILFAKENLSFVTVSNHSKNALLAFFPSLKAECIKVFYSPSTVDDSISLDGYANKYEKYFLIVSGNRWLKNSARAIQAFDELFSERSDLLGKVVITGLTKISDINIKIKNVERFVCIGYVDEVQLKGLYRYAYLLVYPSLNEGFGYPPLEAMHEGCPVIASAIASIPEICGEAVVYFNPYSIPEIKMRILQMENDYIRRDYILKGLERQKYIKKREDEDLALLTDYILSFIKN